VVTPRTARIHNIAFLMLRLLICHSVSRPECREVLVDAVGFFDNCRMQHYAKVRFSLGFEHPSWAYSSVG
jgi:hypothetical protein